MQGASGKEEGDEFRYGPFSLTVRPTVPSKVGEDSVSGLLLPVRDGGIGQLADGHPLGDGQTGIRHLPGTPRKSTNRSAIPSDQAGHSSNR